MEKLKQVVHQCEKWPTGLVSAGEIAEFVGLAEQRIIDLANAGYWPHYRFDGGAPLFQKNESKQWAAKYLLQRFEGNAPAFSFNMIVSVAQRIQNMPPPLQMAKRRGLSLLFREDC